MDKLLQRKLILEAEIRDLERRKVEVAGSLERINASKREAASEQKLVLDADIRPLEKKKQDLLFSLAQLEATHKQAFTQNTQIIKDLEKRKADLLTQVDALKQGNEELSKTYIAVRTEFQKIRNHQLLELADEVKFTKQIASNITHEAQEKRNMADSLLREVQEKEFELKLKEEDLNRRGQDIILKTESLDARVIDDARRSKLVQDRIYEANMILDSLKQSIRELESKKSDLIIHIKVNSEENARQNKIIVERGRILEIKDTANHQTAELLLKQGEEQRKKEAILAGRARAISTALQQLEQKGVSI